LPVMLFSRAFIIPALSVPKKKALHRMTDERLCSTRATLLSSNEVAIVMPASGAENRCNFSDFFKSAARLPRGESGCA
jgi:hypothetical protein